MRPQTTAGRGLLAGFLGAAVLVLWFFVIDTVQASPLRTPAFLADTLLGIEATAALGVALYTIAHFAVFLAIGVGAAWLLDRTDIRPMFPIGVVLGILLFDVIFYAGVLLRGADVVRALGWPEVMIGSLLAGITITGTLALTSDEPSVSWRAALREHHVVREALISGLVGATAVAIWFLLLDAVQGRVFFTPGALGSALFYGVAGAEAVRITATTVLGYTVLHVIAFLVVGFIAAALFDAAERVPPLLLGIVLLFVVFEVLFFGLVAVAAGWLLDALQPWAIIVANLIAAAAMGGYLLYKHPALRREATHELEEEMT